MERRLVLARVAVGNLQQIFDRLIWESMGI